MFNPVLVMSEHSVGNKSGTEWVTLERQSSYESPRRLYRDPTNQHFILHPSYFILILRPSYFILVLRPKQSRTVKMNVRHVQLHIPTLGDLPGLVQVPCRSRRVLL